MQNRKIAQPHNGHRDIARRKIRRVIGAAALVVGSSALVAGAVHWPAHQAFASETPIAQPQLQGLPASFADIVDRVGPAVVNIQVTSHAKPELTNMEGVPNNMQEFFQHFFGDQGQGMPRGMPQPDGSGKGPIRMGAGSGFVIDAEGHIVTNHHVVDGAEEITVTFKNGKTAVAHLIGQDEKTDLALLKIDSDKPVPFVKFGKSDNVRVGDWVLTVGNPFGLGHSVNVGIVSARGRTIGAGPYDDFLQIDAPINRGNSGGPAFDVNGNVVGVNSAIFSPNGGNVGIGFAIPSAIAEKVIADLKSKGVVERGWLGVSIQPVTDDIASGMGRDNTDGALVADVGKDGPAIAAGIRAGDIILDVDGEHIGALKELPRVIADINPGTTSKLKIWRDGAEKSLNVKIGRLPETKVADAGAQSDPVQDDVGLALKGLDAQTARELGLPETTAGVVIVGVKPGSPADGKGLRAGDVVTKAGGKAVTTPGDLQKSFADARQNGKKSVLALVKRSDGQRFIAIPVGAA